MHGARTQDPQKHTAFHWKFNATYNLQGRVKTPPKRHSKWAYMGSHWISPDGARSARRRLPAARSTAAGVEQMWWRDSKFCCLWGLFVVRLRPRGDLRAQGGRGMAGSKRTDKIDTNGVADWACNSEKGPMLSEAWCAPTSTRSDLHPANPVRDLLVGHS